jgi:hypothetical protein
VNGAVGGVGGINLGVVVAWLSGHYGLDMSTEMGVYIGGAFGAAFATLGAAIGRYGVRGCIRRFWIGPPPSETG